MTNFETTRFLLDHLREHPNEAFGSRELARAIIQAHPEEAELKRARSTSDLRGDNLEIQVQAEIGSVKKTLLRRYPQFTVSGTRPTLYSWKPDVLEEEKPGTESREIGNSALEQALYPKLALYLESLSVYAMRIDERRSSGKKGLGANHWRHPDLAALEYLPADWSSITQAFGRHFPGSLLRFWSFEVKRSLSIGNVRESFFQAVSNSSWANFAYLVAEDVDERALQELEILCDSHGLGAIQLNSADPIESRVLIQARERENIDWKVVDRLVSENADFAKFIESATRVIETRTLEVAIPEFHKSTKLFTTDLSRLA